MASPFEQIPTSPTEDKDSEIKSDEVEEENNESEKKESESSLGPDVERIKGEINLLEKKLEEFKDKIKRLESYREQIVLASIDNERERNSLKKNLESKDEGLRNATAASLIEKFKQMCARVSNGENASQQPLSSIVTYNRQFKKLMDGYEESSSDSDSGGNYVDGYNQVKEKLEEKREKLLEAERNNRFNPINEGIESII